MTHDTNTLNGALSQIGETMANNLVTKGVSDADPADGLTTLAGKILTISADDSFELTVSSERALVEDTIIFTATMDTDGETVSLYKGNDLVGTMTDEGDNTYTYELTPITADVGTKTFTAKTSAKTSNTVSVIIQQPSVLTVKEVMGLKYGDGEDYQYGVIYEGCEFIISGNLKSSENLAIANANISWEFGTLTGTVTADTNGYFEIPLYSPHFTDDGVYNLKIIYEGDDSYGRAYTRQEIQYMNLCSADYTSLTCLQTLINNISGGVLHLTHDYEYTSGDPTTGVVITSGITIEGHGHIIDCKESCRLFNTSVNTVINDLNISNCRQANNGGAIYQTAGSLELNNCNFDNCYAMNSAGTTYYYGGAVYTNGTSVKADRCSFNDTKAEQGGSIYISVYGTGGTSASVTNSTFTNNKAKHTGACVLLAVNGFITIDSCTFDNNEVFGSGSIGGALYLISATDKGLTINNSVISNCTAMTTNTAENYGGGGIHIRGSGNSKITNSSFINNQTNFVGGGICYENGAGDITNCKFIHNGSAYGGAVFVWKQSSGTHTISSSLFKENIANSRGAVLESQSGAEVVKNCIILNNTGPSVFNCESGSINANNNWFGNNESNKNTRLVTPGARTTLNQWLYMDLFHSSAIGKEYLRYYVGNWASTSASGSYADSDLLPDCDFVLDQNPDLGDFSNTNPIMGYGSTDTISYYPSGETGTVTIALKKDNVTYYSSSFEIE